MGKPNNPVPNSATFMVFSFPGISYQNGQDLVKLRGFDHILLYVWHFSGTSEFHISVLLLSRYTTGG
jgi:hypothetical protein